RRRLQARQQGQSDRTGQGLEGATDFAAPCGPAEGRGTRLMQPPIANLSHIFGDDCEYCPQTGRPYEQGVGAFTKEQQTANFLREAAALADMAKPGEVCPQTGQAYEYGSGAQTKTRQTQGFLNPTN